MKKIIKGKKYDTKTAKLLFAKSNGLQPEDSEYWLEELYKKRSGDYFLYGKGGGDSKYGEWSGLCGEPGEKIMPLTEDAARGWADREIGDVQEKIFDLINDESVVLGLYVSKTLRDRFIMIRKSEGITSALLLKRLMDSYESGQRRHDS